MGCLNSEGKFEHFFGNIHLSGPCNRSCYFCIGQHMMALDALNNLDKFPLDNLDKFIEKCLEKGVTEVNVTGTNTDPLLYKHTDKLKARLLEAIPTLKFGIRTNGVLAIARHDIWNLYDKGSLTICSFNPTIYREMMGQGEVPDVAEILEMSKWKDLKLNVVLGPENCKKSWDIYDTLDKAAMLGIKRVNLREPYGQPHVGDPLVRMTGIFGAKPTGVILGMPSYDWRGISVLYWDVHYVEVESVNLYANGNVSETYPITKGHDPSGKVLAQENFPGGRIQPQWLSYEKVV